MKSRLIIALVLGAGLLAFASYLLGDDLDEDASESDGDHAYGEPDNETAGGDVASLVD